MCLPGFAVGHQVGVSSEGIPWPQGLMTFLNVQNGKFQENRRGSVTSAFGTGMTAAGILHECSSPLHNSRGY